MTAVPGAAPIVARENHSDQILRLLERALALVDESALPADVGARLDDLIQTVRQWRTSVNALQETVV